MLDTRQKPCSVAVAKLHQRKREMTEDEKSQQDFQYLTGSIAALHALVAQLMAAHPEPELAIARAAEHASVLKLYPAGSDANLVAILAFQQQIAECEKLALKWREGIANAASTSGS